MKNLNKKNLTPLTVVKFLCHAVATPFESSCEKLQYYGKFLALFNF